MGLIRLRVRELAAEKGWTLKEVSERSGISYGTVRSYAHSLNLATVDYTALQKLVGCNYKSLTKWIDKFLEGGLEKLTEPITHQVPSRDNIRFIVYMC